MECHVCGLFSTAQVVWHVVFLERYDNQICCVRPLSVFRNLIGWNEGIQLTPVFLGGVRKSETGSFQSQMIVSVIGFKMEV